MAIVDELITLLGLETDSSVNTESSKYNKALGGMTKTASILAAGIIAAQTAITGFIVSFAASTDEAGKFAKQNNIAFESLQELEFAVKRAGGSASELRGDIAKLAEEFGNLGPADQTLLNIAERMEGLSAIEQLQLGRQLGLSEGTIRLLQEGRSGIESLRKEARSLGVVLSEDTAKKAAEFQDQLTNLKGVFMGLAGAIAAGLLPELTEVTQGITEFVQANQDLIKSGVEQFIAGVSMGFGIVGDAISFLLGLLPEFEGELNAVRIIALAVAGAVGILAANMLIAAAPFLLMAAAIGVVLLIIEDLWVAFQGGDSVIGGLVDSFANRFPKIFEFVKTVFNGIIAFFSDIGPKMFSSLIDAFNTNFELIKNIVLSALQFIEDLLSGVSLSEATDKLLGGLSDAFSAWFDESLDNFFGFITDLSKSIFSFADKFKGFFGFGEPAVANVPASVVNDTSNSNTQSDNRQMIVNIDGAGNPAQVGRSVADATGFGTSMLNAVPTGGG